MDCLDAYMAAASASVKEMVDRCMGLEPKPALRMIFSISASIAGFFLQVTGTEKTNSILFLLNFGIVSVKYCMMYR